MKRLATCLLTCFAALQLSAAEGEWLTDFDKAKEIAAKENKLILMDFTGSDWCPPCKALHKNVFSDKAFVDYAKENLVLVEVDFPRRKEQPEALKKANKALAERFSIEGYPTVIVLDSKGKQLNKEVGYSGAKAGEYVESLKALKKS